MSYNVIQSTSVSGLVTAVNDFITANPTYAPVGKPEFLDGSWSQAVGLPVSSGGGGASRILAKIEGADLGSNGYKTLTWQGSNTAANTIPQAFAIKRSNNTDVLNARITITNEGGIGDTIGNSTFAIFVTQDGLKSKSDLATELAAALSAAISPPNLLFASDGDDVYISDAGGIATGFLGIPQLSVDVTGAITIDNLGFFMSTFNIGLQNLEGSYVSVPSVNMILMDKTMKASVSDFGAFYNSGNFSIRVLSALKSQYLVDIYLLGDPI